MVVPSVPILYFGDSRAYERSEVRVITVGLNPSREEFPRSDPLSRFPTSPLVGEDDLERYLSSLDAYYRTLPYTRWFNGAFESLLNGFESSYYEGRNSTAIHTDLCTPLATDPTWSRLDNAERALLEPDGKSLWHALVDALEPDVVLVSVARQHLGKITFAIDEPPRVLYTIDGPNRRTPYQVEVFRHALPSGKHPLFVFGRASQTPFGSISRAEKKRVGELAAELVNA